jgi:ABC-type transport system substrate-binding protein
MVPGANIPNPDNPKGTLTFVTFDVGPGTGLHSAQAPVEAMHDWGISDTLFGSDVDGNFDVPQIATGYELASDLSYVDITIREGVMFQRGYGEQTAEDWVWTMNESNAFTNPSSIHGQAGDFAALFGEATQIDKYSFRLPFRAYDLRWLSNFLNDAAQATTAFSKNAYDTEGESWMMENIIGDGPFQVVEWIRDDKAIFEKRPDGHWRIDTQVDRASVLEVPEEATRVAMLQTGAADSAFIDVKSAPALQEDGFGMISPSMRGNVHNIIMDGNYWETKHAITGEPLDTPGYCVHDLPWVGCVKGCPEGEWDSPECKHGATDMAEARHVRRALAFAIDRELLNEAVLEGLGTYASIEYVDTTMPYYQSRWDIPYDIDMAREEMAKADSAKFQEGDFEMPIWTGGEYQALNKEINDAVAGMWSRAWPKMDISVYKSAYAIIRPSIVQRSNTMPYAGDGDEGATTIPFDWPHGMTESSLTRGGFGSGIEIPMIAETYIAVNAEPDINKRVQLNEALIDYLIDEALMIGTVQVPNIWAYNPKSIAEWPKYPSIFANMCNIEAIVPADR